MKKPILILLLIATITVSYSQGRPAIKPGKISVADFVINSPVVDSNSGAVILADIGSCKFVGNNKGWFSIIFSRYKRIKILNKTGFEAANVEIGLYGQGDEVDKLKNLKATTYNLENGSVISIEVAKKDVFQEAVAKNYLEKKFAFPAVRNGSIIEYSYEIESEGLFHLPAWTFQGEYPCLWSSYEVQVPAMFNYTILKQGDFDYWINSTDQKAQVFSVRKQADQAYPPEAERVYMVNTVVTIKNWAMKDVPGMPVQNYTSSIQNYVSRLEFQLSEFRFPDQPVESKVKTWQMLATEMLKDEDFGRPIAEENFWVTDELKKAGVDGVSDDQKARNIFAYIRDNYTCTRPYGIFLSESMDLKSIIKKKSGSVSDLNLLLIAMLRKISLNADPVLISTREHGRIHPQYPMLQEFNYVVCYLNVNGVSNYLDVSNPYMGYNRLQSQCYNGMGQVIATNPKPVSFNADELSENKICLITLSNSSSGMTGKCETLLGYDGSLRLRQKILKDGAKDYFTDEEKKYAEDARINNWSFDSLKSFDNPVTIKYDVSIKLANDQLIYFNPMLAEQIKENPFKAQTRVYPIELPYISNDAYVLNMEIPDGYKVDELPKSEAFALPGNKARFEYQLLLAGNRIQLKCNLWLNKTFFSVSEYESMRSLFAQIIRKENEHIVFKKVN